MFCFFFFFVVVVVVVFCCAKNVNLYLSAKLYKCENVCIVSLRNGLDPSVLLYLCACENDFGNSFYEISHLKNSRIENIKTKKWNIFPRKFESLNQIFVCRVTMVDVANGWCFFSFFQEWFPLQSDIITVSRMVHIMPGMHLVNSTTIISHIVCDFILWSKLKTNSHTINHAPSQVKPWIQNKMIYSRLLFCYGSNRNGFAIGTLSLLSFFSLMLLLLVLPFAIIEFVGADKSQQQNLTDFIWMANQFQQK